MVALPDLNLIAVLAGRNVVGNSIDMAFRYIVVSILSALTFVGSSAGWAADCVMAREGYDDRGRKSVFLTAVAGACGSLKVVDRRRDDPRHQVNIYATYPVFDPPRNAAERRYNDWVGKRPARMNFTGAVELSGSDIADTMVGVLYRSPRLLSARVGVWVCCGAHGSSWTDSLNIDPQTGRDVRLADLVGIAAVADFCWKQFSQQDGPMDGQGKIFGRAYPRESFANVLQRTTWSVSERGLVIDLGYLLGYVGAEFACVIGTEDLLRFAKHGTAVPF